MLPSRVKNMMTWLILSTLVSGFLFLPLGTAFAQQPNQARVIINGVEQRFPAFNINHRTLVPLRGVFEALGGTVQWDEQKEQVRVLKGNDELLLQLGSEIAFINGDMDFLDVPARKIDGSVMVPLRFIAETLGANVEWIPETETVSISVSGASSGMSGAKMKCNPEWLDESKPIMRWRKVVIHDADQPVYMMYAGKMTIVPDVKLPAGSEKFIWDTKTVNNDSYYQVGTNLYVKIDQNVSVKNIPQHDELCWEKELYTLNVKRIVNGAMKLKSPLAKVLYVHNLLIDHLRELHTPDDIEDIENVSAHRSPEVALATGIASDKGYANTLSTLLDLIGIENNIVEGTHFDVDEENNQKEYVHYWNMVKLDGEWYHIDANWNDSYRTMAFFLISDEELKKRHPIQLEWSSEVVAANDRFKNYALIHENSPVTVIHIDYQRERIYYALNNAIWYNSLDLSQPKRLTPETLRVGDYRDIHCDESGIYFGTSKSYPDHTYDGIYRISHNGEKLTELYQGFILDWKVYNGKLYLKVLESDDANNDSAAFYVSELDGSGLTLLRRYSDFQQLSDFYVNEDIQGRLFYSNDKGQQLFSIAAPIE
jgi:hypothetical protein